MRQNSKFVVAAFGATNVTTLTASIDTRGFSYARIYCIANTTAAVHTTGSNNILQESDDNSNFTTITAAGCSGYRRLGGNPRIRTPYFCEVAVTPGAGAGAGSAGVELTGAGWPTRR